MSNSNEDAYFGRFVIPSASIFYRSPEQGSMAFVNLRPIVTGHVLIMTQRIVPYLRDLTDQEYIDLWRTVRTVQAMLRKHYDCDAFNVAVQDGQAAGQSVPHVHVHILPRKDGDYERNDDIYNDLEEWAPRPELRLEKPKLQVADDTDRRDRTREDMASEAALYRNILNNL